jgi:hypothetical protein
MADIDETFFGNMAPILMAAEKYAEAVKDYEDGNVDSNPSPHVRHMALDLRRDKLLEAAIKYGDFMSHLLR